MTDVKPGLAALQSIGEATWGLIYPAGGGRVEIVADDGDDGPDAFDQTDDDDEDEDEAEEDDRPQRRRPARPRNRRRDEPEQDETDEDEDVPTREELQRVKDAIRRNNAENSKYRHLAKQLKGLGYSPDQPLDEWMAANGLLSNGNPEQQPQVEQEPEAEQEPQTPKHDPAKAKLEAKRHEARGAARVQAKYEPALVRVGAKAALADAGWAGKNMAMALRLIDPTRVEVDFDEDGEPVFDGLIDQIDDIKSEFPMWFRSPGARPRDPERDLPARRRRVDSRDVDGGNSRTTQRAKPKGWLEQLDVQMRG